MNLAEKYNNPVPSTSFIDLRKSTVMNPADEIEVDECNRSRSAQSTLSIPGENKVNKRTDTTGSSEWKSPLRMRKFNTSEILEGFELHRPGEVKGQQSSPDSEVELISKA